MLQVLAVHFRRLLHSPGIFLQKQKILPDFQKDKFSLFLHAPLQTSQSFEASGGLVLFPEKILRFLYEDFHCVSMLGFHRQAYHLTDHLLKYPPCKKSGFFFPLLIILCLSFPANRQKELQKAIFPPLCLRQNNEDPLSALPQTPVKALFLPLA